MVITMHFNYVYFLINDVICLFLSFTILFLSLLFHPLPLLLRDMNSTLVNEIHLTPSSLVHSSGEPTGL
jgi:hypothetical protein